MKLCRDVCTEMGGEERVAKTYKIFGGYKRLGQVDSATYRFIQPLPLFPP